jgi:glutathione synthetase
MDASFVPFSTSIALDEELQSFIKDEIREWALAHGLLLGGRVAPVTVFPTPLRTSFFDEALQLAIPFNTLTHHVANDIQFLTHALRHVHDTFTQKLLTIYKQVLTEGIVQTKVLGIHRSDYMIHTKAQTGTPTLKQVEMNRISVAFGALSTLTGQLHRYLVEQLEWSSRYPPSALPVSDSRTLLPAHLARAHQLYGRPNAVVLMVVQPGEKNSIDQRWIQYLLWENHRVRVLRRTHLQVAQRGKLEPSSNALYIDGHEVAVIYFRSGYTPKDYPTEQEWQARLMMERSLAIKCPSVGYQLCGLKKIQQVLTEPGVLERFVSNKQEQERLRACFASQFSLDPEPGVREDTVSRLLARPQDYVMKPQREGGGNLLYGTRMVRALLTTPYAKPFEANYGSLAADSRNPTDLKQENDFANFGTTQFFVRLSSVYY